MQVLNPQRKAFLDMVAWSEGTDNGRQPTRNHGYDVIVGGELFADYSDHPRKLVTLNLKLKSTAAGRYQLLSRWWDTYRKQLGLKDFSPESQDAVALQQIKERGALPGTTADFQNMMQMLVRQGIPAENILGGVGKATAYLAVQLKKTPEAAAEFAAKMQDATGTASEDMMGLFDTIQKAFYLGVDDTNMLSFFTKTSSVLKMVNKDGLQAAQSLAPISVMMDQMGMNGESAGNALRKVIQSGLSVKKIRDVNKVMARQKLGVQLDFTDGKGSFGGLDNMFRQLAKLRKLTDVKRTGVLKAIFGDDAETLQVVNALIDKGKDAATAQTLMSSCSALDDCISDSFSGFSIDGVADFVQNDVVGNASTMLGYVSDAMKVVDSAVSDAARLLQGDISVLLPPPSSGKNFVEQVQKMWRTGKRLYGNASDLVTMIKTLSGVSLGSDLQPRGVWKTDSKTTATATQQRNVVASTLRTTAISEAAYAVTRLPAPTTSAVMQNAAVGQATTPAQSTGWPSVTHPALNNAPAVKNTVDLPTWEELTDIRDTLNTAIDKELSRTTSDALFLALRRVKADLNADINTRLEQSARIIQRTPDEVLPALVLAATWFDNAARDADIIRRNAITHPGFVPVIPLKVPVQ